MKKFIRWFIFWGLIGFNVTNLNAEVLNVYIIKQKESLESVTKKLLPSVSLKYGKRIDDYKKDLVSWNPHIANWSEIPLFSTIYTDYPYPIYISHPYAPSLLGANKNYHIVNADAETPSGDNKFTLFGMYTASSGDFQETLTGQTGNIKSTQNSPISLGLGGTLFLNQNSRMISGSIYWSHLQASKLSGAGINNSELKVNPEIGFNLYYQQLIPYGGISLYGGADYEQFSTYNTNAFTNGATLGFNQNKILYGTFGAGKTFFFNDQRLLVKTSIAKSLSSTTTSPIPNDEFTGTRFLLFSSWKGESRFTYHILYKRHMLDGPTKLTINRIGIGMGFVIF